MPHVICEVKRQNDRKYMQFLRANRRKRKNDSDFEEDFTGTGTTSHTGKVFFNFDDGEGNTEGSSGGGLIGTNGSMEEGIRRNLVRGGTKE